MQHETLQVLRDSSIVENVEDISFQGYEETFRLEARAILVNAWKLDVFIHRTEDRDRYSFHVSEDAELVVRWDNAPHHPGIRTHPYHRHENDEIHPSEEMDVRKVLREIGERMEQK
ncbi:MAG: DUF6516 family protein [Candidatus Nanohaloarchaeota archaeon QJJ-7]|nr:DUF6516 family protein [Candidatus Nanohaloarchaeota archaeon QJJ-7]